MIAKFRFLQLFGVLLACAALPGNTPAYAQPGYYGGQTITCSSDSGSRNYCNIDTRGGVRLSRQISGSPCVQGQTWGWDNRGVWVDRGCRAEFVAGNGGNWGGGGNWNGQTITCSSDDGGRNYCDTYGANPRNITLSRQISGSPCTRGQTWGVDNRGLWVDRGCRAEFSVGGGGNGGNWGGGGGNSQSVTCSSDDGGRNYCNIDTRGGVRLSRQISGSPCIEGQTWGWDGRGVWVDRGCRAEFVTGGGHGGNWGPGNSAGRTFTCSSDNGSRNYCSVPSGVNLSGVTMSRQISGSPCVQGQTWGVDRRGLWVDRGCRAEFRSNY